MSLLIKHRRGTSVNRKHIISDTTEPRDDVRGGPVVAKLGSYGSGVPDHWIPAIVPCILRWTQETRPGKETLPP